MMKKKNTRRKGIALMLMTVFACQLFYPNVSLALTTGPSQPEVQGFEPVGTTDMVDMFSGSFVYNIPLMDVEGYPVNIAYHGGVSMEQEASWVGLGWNINPGVINRTVRGVPDDFNGDSIYKDFHIRPESNLRVGVGVGLEVIGVGDPFLGLNFSFGANVNVSNYRGVSCDFDLGAGINFAGAVSTGVNIGVGSQSGATIDYNCGLRFSTSDEVSSEEGGSGALSLNVGGGYNTRSGLKDMSLSVSVSASSNCHSNTKDGPKGKNAGSGTFGGGSIDVPIGTRNYLPVITNSSTMRTIYGRVKIGGEVFGALGYATVNGRYSMLTFANDATRDAYGYLYLQNSRIDNTSILDFTRDKDGMFNQSMQYLPVPSMTYDIYSLSGQGTAGIFRPFRNDFGNVYDPLTTSKSTSTGGAAEVGLGNAFEAGTDRSDSRTEISSGPWPGFQRSGTLSKGFAKKANGSIYENVYFKQAGELSYVDSSYYDAIGKTTPMTPDNAMGLPQRKPGSMSRRDSRANLMYYYTAKEDTVTGVGIDPKIFSYTDNSFTTYGNPTKANINRIGSGKFQRRKDQISEIVQVQKDGRKYVYGIPAMNNVQREVTFSVDPVSNSVDLDKGTVTFTGTDASNGNGKGRDQFYSSTVTPSYAHSYLLTSVLSADYIDVTGNGISDDDLGSYTKFNYTRRDSDYRWIAPYSSSINVAQYNPGFWSDTKDDKGNFVCGSREQWILHAIETKNYIAEFYTSSRHDAKGITAKILNSNESPLFNNSKEGPSLSYRLDSMKLYNKHDRFINTSNAVPIKTVFFVYDYSLCDGVPNADAGYGKLTLKKIYFRYGNSQKSMLSPYQFGYGLNPNYNFAAKDRWGTYKESHAFANYEFPYVDQNDPDNDPNASAWSLTNITLPSGGVIEANYECNDYAFVQDKPANEMFIVKGLGNSIEFGKGNQLFTDKNSPNVFAYFERRPGKELPNLTFAQNYMGRNYIATVPKRIYFNFNVALTSAEDTYEQIKGYGNVTEIGKCSGDTSYGYVKFESVVPIGGQALLHPVTYTALNTARYNLPQVVFPGQDPKESDIQNILSGLKGSFGELTSMGKSPVIYLVTKGGGKNVHLDKSCIRLQSVGLCKKGGGQRVKSLSFKDEWNTLTGGNEHNAFYGKQYDYTIKDNGYGTISSGVASYEPLIGGDENPWRQPIPYAGQSGNDGWFPNDPVGLYQEEPIGESLFPAGQVGYSLVTVKSIHSEVGKSSQGVDKYEFYTAKDFPAQVLATPIDARGSHNYGFFSQKNQMVAKQGYTLIFNDMHGKQKKVEHDVYNPASQTLQPISYQIFNYRTEKGLLNNRVKCLEYDGGQMMVKTKQLGVEVDFTMDSRQKNEHTYTITNNSNINFFFIPAIFPVPVLLPYGFTWPTEAETEFQSAVTAKVVQQYGIIDNIVSYSEGAITTLQNELYDPMTGQPIVTSVTNEYKDKEYTTNIPASWVYKGMDASYQNIGYTDSGVITVGSNYVGTLNMTNSSPLLQGDELAVSYKDVSGVNHNISAWVMGITKNTPDSVPILSPHYHYDTTFTITSFDSVQVCYASNFKLHNWWLYNVSGLQHNVSNTGYCYMSDTCFSPFNPSASYPTTITCPSLIVQRSIGGTFMYYDTINLVTSATVERADSHIQGTNPFLSGYDTVLVHGTFNYSGYPHVFEAQVHQTISGVIGTRYDTTFYSSYSYTTYDTTGYHIYPAGSCAQLKVLPRFPLTTPGWNVGDLLTNAKIRVVNSGHKNMLTENVESYRALTYPLNSLGQLLSGFNDVIDIKAKTFSDSNTRIPRNYILNADTVNPYAIGERGMWRLQSEYAYVADRRYANVSARRSGLYYANSMFASASYSCPMSEYNYLMPVFTDPAWRVARTVTKWSPKGGEVENVDPVGNYSTALYGYKDELPVAIASNAKQGQIIADGFEDYHLLQPVPDILSHKYSPFNIFSSAALSTPSPYYEKLDVTPSSGINVVSAAAHTGLFSLSVPSGGSPAYSVTLPVDGSPFGSAINNYNNYFSFISGYVFSGRNEYKTYGITPGNSYILSCWVKQSGASTNATSYNLDPSCGITVAGSTFYPMMKKTNLIEGWQQEEITFIVPYSATTTTLALPAGYYIDDIRIFPSVSNMKSFVYNPINEKLMATLDENNFATMYEYDQEGNLVRTKKETEKGIMTISESRSGNPKR